MADCSVQTLLASACSSGFNGRNQGELLAIIAQLLCEILHAGGGGGQSCLLCSVASDPVDAPTCDCAIYYRKDISKFWYWDAEALTWFPFIV